MLHQSHRGVVHFGQRRFGHEEIAIGHGSPKAGERVDITLCSESRVDCSGRGAANEIEGISGVEESRNDPRFVRAACRAAAEHERPAPLPIVPVP